MSPEFLRQRRNLIGISIIIILFSIAEISSESISIWGGTFRIGKPEILPYFAWVLWFYFLLRYHQYLNKESNFNIRNEFFEKRNSYLNDYLKNKNAFDGRSPMFQGFNLVKVGIFKWKFSISGFGNQEDKVDKSVDVPSKYICWVYIKSFMFTIFQTNQFTEFLLPYVISFSAPIIYYIKIKTS